MGIYIYSAAQFWTKHIFPAQFYIFPAGIFLTLNAMTWDKTELRGKLEAENLFDFWAQLYLFSKVFFNFGVEK